MNDAPHNTAAGIARVIEFARKGQWYLLPSTRDRAIALGVDVSGVKFRGPGE
jgi:hypothetical protein